MRQHAGARAQINRLRKDIALPLVELQQSADATRSVAGLSQLGRELVGKIEELGK